MAVYGGCRGRRKGLATEGQVGSRRIVHSGFSLSGFQCVKSWRGPIGGGIALALGLFRNHERLKYWAQNTLSRGFGIYSIGWHPLCGLTSQEAMHRSMY